MPERPEDLHEWLSFEDPEEERTWVFDVTFLLSSWTCIFGRGCQGVLTEASPELSQGCCSYGAHFTDPEDVATAERGVRRLTGAQWQYQETGIRDGWVVPQDDGSMQTRLVDGACIFLNRPGFSGGTGCALHVGAVEAGDRPHEWKPNVCWQLPLRLADHTDEHGYITTTVREWKRRDWGPGGFEFHWWCTESPDAFVGSRPTYVELRDEIVALCGPKVYDLLVEQLERRSGRVRHLPHPAVRR